jgi:hypothetical protein
VLLNVVAKIVLVGVVKTVELSVVGSMLRDVVERVVLTVVLLEETAGVVMIVDVVLLDVVAKIVLVGIVKTKELPVVGSVLRDVEERVALTVVLLDETAVVVQIVDVVPVLPTGRNVGRKTQKWPYKNISGRKNPRPNYWQIFQKMAEKWPNLFLKCICHIKALIIWQK